MTSSYAPVEWTPGPITLPGLQQMANNEQYLFENLPTMRYSAPGIARTGGIRVAAGIMPFGSTKQNYLDMNIYFGNFFTSGCRPVVNTTVHSFYRGRKFCSIEGLAGATTVDSRGFLAVICSVEPVGSDNGIHGGILHWTAIGY
jgi:hypothetical protein